MFKIGIVGCGLQAATIASYLSVFGDEYEVNAVMDLNEAAAKTDLVFRFDCEFCIINW